MEGVKQRIVKAQELLQQVKQKRQEVQKSVREQASRGNTSNSDTIGWNRGASSPQYRRSADPLEAEFQQWEIDEELEQIRKNMQK